MFTVMPSAVSAMARSTGVGVCASPLASVLASGVAASGVDESSPQATKVEATSAISIVEAKFRMASSYHVHALRRQ